MRSKIDHLAKPRHRAWTPAEEELLGELYLDTPTADLARLFGRPIGQVYQKAARMGLKKSAAYLESPAACKLRRGENVGAAFRFRKGHRPHNAGVVGWQSGGRSRETQFKAGQRGNKWVPIGTERETKDGYLQRKVADTPLSIRNWKLVHLIVWESLNGPVPPGHAVIFRDGVRTNVEASNLELIRRSDLMRRNSIQRFPPELKSAIQVVAKLKRVIRNIEAPA